MNVPANLLYAESHEWVKIEGTTATVGITDHAQNLLGDVVFLQLPAVGKIVKPKAPVAVVESVKAASDIYAPLSGEIIEVNNAPVENTTLVNTSPYDEAWMFKIKLSAPEEVTSLLKDAAAYSAQIAV
jgi:glycine cleavage system H protein